MPSLKVPVALKPWVVEGASNALEGEMANETRVALLTVSIVEPNFVVSALKVAVIFAVPAAIPVTVWPFMVATAILSELQVQSFVMVWLDESLNAPVAAKLCLVPGAIVGFIGVTVTETIVAGVIFTVSIPATGP